MDIAAKEDIIKAGQLAHEVRMYGYELIVKGASYVDVITKIRAKVKELGAIEAFPPQIAINDTAAHYYPAPGDDYIFGDDLISLDVGVCVNGAIGDCAISKDLSEDKKYEHYVSCAKECLEEAQRIIRVGLEIGKIGEIIEKTAKKYGLTSVKNLSGHGLGPYQIHTKPTIPNYNNFSTKQLEPNMHFAIEPFVTDGKGLIYESGEPVIFSFIAPRAVRSPITKLALKKIQTFQNLPFVLGDLVSKDFPLFKAKFAIRDLLQSGIIQGHPPLVEETHKMVAQAENTVYIDELGNVHITTK